LIFILCVLDIAIEEERQRQRAQDARNLKAKVKEAKKTTVDDLTRGIINYKFTGLDFEKTNTENELLYVCCSTLARSRAYSGWPFVCRETVF
jgi:hypothetical protein